MAKTLTLSNGAEIPAFGLGTWKSKPGEVRAAVLEAIRAGYRHVDCAWIYGNEPEVGEALSELFDGGEVARDDVWVTSKLWNDRHAPEDVEPALRETLDHLGLERLDLYLIHWPVALKKGVMVARSPDDQRSLEDVPLTETWSAMEALVDAGLCRSIGVSNFSAVKLGRVLDAARIPPAMNQVEMHPYLAQDDLLTYCKDRGVAVTAYSPLGSRDRPASLKADDEPVLLEDPAIEVVAAKHDASPAQVLIAWALARGTAVIPKSVNAERIRQNLAATELTLDEEDLERIAELDRHRRYVDGAFWALEGGPYTVAGLWDE